MGAQKMASVKPVVWSLIWLAIILLVLFVMVSNVLAQEPTPAPPEVTDDQVNAIAKQLFCPVCENIPLDVCPTQACAQWRDLIREKLAAGWNERQIKNYFVEQYGARVLGAPPAKGINWLVYIVPPIAILGGIIILVQVVRGMRPQSGTQPATAAASPSEVDNEYIRRLEEELRYKTETRPTKATISPSEEESLKLKESSIATGKDGLCDVCNTEVDKFHSHLISAFEFHRIVQNGFNPFMEETGLHLSALGAVFGTSSHEQYQGWKIRVFADNSSWNLCNRCYSIAFKYRGF